MPMRVSDYPINSFLEAYKRDLAAKGIKVEDEPFFFNADFTPLNAVTTLNQVNTTDADAAFAVFQTMQTTYNAATGAYVPFPNCAVRLTDDATGRSLEDRPTHLNAIFGRGQRPFYWVRPLVIDPKSSWTTTLSNLEAATNFNVRLCYSGVKLKASPLR